MTRRPRLLRLAHALSIVGAVLIGCAALDGDRAFWVWAAISYGWAWNLREWSNA